MNAIFWTYVHCIVCGLSVRWHGGMAYSERIRTECHRWSELLKPSKAEFARRLVENDTLVSPEPFVTRLGQVSADKLETSKINAQANREATWP